MDAADTIARRHVSDTRHLLMAMLVGILRNFRRVERMQELQSAVVFACHTQERAKMPTQWLTFWTHHEGKTARCAEKIYVLDYRGLVYFSEVVAKPGHPQDKVR